MDIFKKSIFNHIPKPLVLGVLCTLNLLLSGCDSSETKLPVPISIDYQHQQCGVAKPMITQVKNAEDWSLLTQSSNILGSQPRPIPEFDNVTYYHVAAGTKPSAGFTYLLTEELAEWDEDTLILPLDLKEPDGMSASVLTSPCVIVQLAGENVGPVRVD
ncbi:MAG: hypothetical protein AAGJ37_10515 [Pseudomonadota bacterium]